MFTFYILLIVGTLIIAWLGYKMWCLEKNIAIIVGLLILYYWSIAGSWFIVWDSFNNLSGYKIGLHYYYLFEKLFVVKADSYYFRSLVYYLSFIIFTQLSYLFFYRKRNTEPVKIQTFQLNHWTFIIIAITACAGSIFCILNVVQYALENNIAIYTITRQSGNYLFSIHQLLNHIAVFSVIFGYTSLVMDKEKKYFVENPVMMMRIIYPVVVFIVLSYMLVLGNKHELFFTSIFILLFFFTFSKRIIIKRLVLLMAIVSLPLLLNDFMRRYTPEQLKMVATGENTDLITDTSNVSILSYVVFSNELFSAHMSMYGVLKNNLEPDYGSSLVSLAASMIPRILWKDRPQEIYYYYSDSLHLKAGQSYTINHATAWYLNFGMIGILLGGIVVGFLWSGCYYLHNFHSDSAHKFIALICILAICSFTAFMPFLIRNGPESYKALIFEGLLLPGLIVFLASYIQRSSGEK
jgi:hypothetical protein